MPRRSRLGALGAVAVLGALLPRAAVLHLPTVCPIRQVTGYPCPTCGMVRSWHSMARLDPLQAIRDHPFGPPALAAIAAEAWQPGLVELAMRRAGRMPPAVRAAALLAWLGWWGSRLVAAHRSRRRR